MIKLKITETRIKAWDLCPLTVGNVNSLSVELSFSASWSGLGKYAVFANGDTVVSVPLSTDTCPIPWEVLAHTGELFVSLRGMTDGGNVVLCTENAFLGRVHSSLAAAIAEEYREKTPDVLDALVERVTGLEGRGDGSGGGRFIVQIEDIESQPIVADKTLAEITAAYNSGKTVELWLGMGGDIDTERSILKLVELEDNRMAIFQYDYMNVHYDVFVNYVDGVETWGYQVKYLPGENDVAVWYGKQDTITANGLLKGDGSGGITAAVAGTDYAAPPAQITGGTNIALADNTEYRLSDVSTMTLTYPIGNFECWLRIATAASGAITITLPTSTYVGDAPTFGNGEVWELSIKDGVVVAGKAVSA